MRDEDAFSLDELVVEEEEVKTPAIMPVTVLVSEIDFDQQEKLTDVVEAIQKRLFEKYGFCKKERRTHREGFLDFNTLGNKIKCFYVRETPTRLDYEKGDLKISTRRLRSINPSYRVLVYIHVMNDKAKIVLFGGDDKISALALDLVNFCIRGSVKGNFQTYPTSFTKEEMDAILLRFGIEIQYVFLSPGESEKLRKIAKRKIKGETKEVPLYFARAKFAGYRVVAAPAVLELISEGKISLQEIEGKLAFAGGISITARVSASGRITFFIPENIVPRKETAYGIAEELYKRILPTGKNVNIKQLGLGIFINAE